MSRVVLVEADWTIPNENLPEKIILKLTSCINVHHLVSQMKEKNPDAFTEQQEAELWAMFEREAQNVHNREVNLYRITEKWNKNDALLSPKIYFYKKFDCENKTQGVLGMEYVDDAVVRHLYCNAKPHELHPILQSLATLQAGSLHLTEDEINSISGYDFKSMVGRMMSEEGMKQMYTRARQINPERLTKPTDAVEALGMDIVNFEISCHVNKYAGIQKNVLVHGDLWAANILWKENDGNCVASKVIDYQLIHMGNPAEDLVRVFLSTLSGADRQAHWEKLLEQFYEYFLEALEGNEAPYTLDQLKESYRLYFVGGGLFVMPLFGPVAQAKLSYSTDNENVEEYREVLTEKAERLMEDLKRWHLYSKDVTKDLETAEKLTL